MGADGSRWAGWRSHGPAARPGAVGRAWRASRRTAPTVLVGAVFAGAGLLFATSAATARGTQLRADEADLPTIIREENARHDAAVERLARLRAEQDALTAPEAGAGGAAGDLSARITAVAPAAGLTPVSGRGLVVTLDDASTAEGRPAGAAPDDLVVHQQDVQGVVNALWAGGARAMTIMDQRVVSTSAVRCVGNTLLLQGRLYSPPYRIAAVGDPAALRAGLQASPTVPIYLEFVSRFGLGWSVEERDVVAPAYAGSLDLAHVRPVGAAPSASGPATSAR